MLKKYSLNIIRLKLQLQSQTETSSIFLSTYVIDFGRIRREREVVVVLDDVDLDAAVAVAVDAEVERRRASRRPGNQDLLDELGLVFGPESALVGHLEKSLLARHSSTRYFEGGSTFETRENGKHQDS